MTTARTNYLKDIIQNRWRPAKQVLQQHGVDDAILGQGHEAVTNRLLHAIQETCRSRIADTTDVNSMVRDMSDQGLIPSSYMARNLLARPFDYFRQDRGYMPSGTDTRMVLLPATALASYMASGGDVSPRTNEIHKEFIEEGERILSDMVSHITATAALNGIDVSRQAAAVFRECTNPILFKRHCRERVVALERLMEDARIPRGAETDAFFTVLRGLV